MGEASAVGQIIPYYTTELNPPTIQSHLYCDGSTFDQSLYPDLYTILGNTNILPDLRNQTLKGAGNQNVGFIESDQVGSHKHTIL